jgi:hypothetical protein
MMLGLFSDLSPEEGEVYQKDILVELLVCGR